MSTANLWFVAALLLLGISTASAEGFAVKDFRNIGDISLPTQGSDFETKIEQNRITIACISCSDLLAVDIQLGTSTDGTEGRFRSGETTLETLEQQCRNNDDTCRLERLDIDGAVGWQSIYSRGSTAVLFKDGDRLIIRGVVHRPNK